MRTMKKLEGLLLAAAMTAGLLSGCGSSSSSSGSSQGAQTAQSMDSIGSTEKSQDSTSSADEAGDVADTAKAGDATGDLDPDKKVDKIEVGSNPTKTAYVSGETFSLDGGTIVVTYDDGTTQEIPMSASCFTIKEPGMTSSGTKTVTVKCGNKSTRFTVDVAESAFTVTYNLNYDGAPDPEVASVNKGQTTEATTPTREGYTFVGWYINPDFTEQYDFSTPPTDNIELYALWTRDDATYVNVTFDYNYYGKKLSSYSVPVESGTAVAEPSADPERVDYTFDGWVDENGDPYDFTQPVSADTTIKASWTKAVSGIQTYVFEAEDTDLSGKSGPAISGTANESGMIVLSEGKGASNDRSVGYLYQNGSSLEFYLACDEDVDDATIAVSLSAEMDDLTLTPDNYGIYLNDEKLQYDTISITDVPAYDAAAYVADCAPFQYYVIGENLSLKKGSNLIRLVTENNDGYTGTTMVAHAPLVDAVKVETTGVVTWDENHDEPATGNYEQ